MNTSVYDDMIAKAIQLVEHQGTIQTNTLGTHKNFEDERINIQAFLANGMDLLIRNVNGSIVLEVWKGIVIIHSGNHLSLYEHLNRIFYGWHKTFNLLKTR